MEHNNYLEDGLRLLKEQPVVFIITGFFAMLISGASFGILSGPLFGAYLLMAINLLRDDKEAQFMDIFTGFSRLLTMIPFMVVSILIILGFYLYIFPGVMLLICFIYTLPLMIDKDMSLFKAMKASFDKVKEKGFYIHFSFLFILVIIPEFVVYMFSAFMPLLKICRLLLIPFQCGCLASLYLENFDKDSTRQQITKQEIDQKKHSADPTEQSLEKNNAPASSDDTAESTSPEAPKTPPLPDSE